MSAKDPRKVKKFFLIFWKAIVKLSVVIRALIVRGLFVAFIFLAVWNVVIVQSNDLYWLLLGCAIPFAAEVLYACKVIFIEKKDSSRIGKWFSPVVLLFLCSACPTIWIIEISIWRQLQPSANVSDMTRNMNSSSRNVSSVNMVVITLEFTLNVQRLQQRSPTRPPTMTTQLGSLLLSIAKRTSKTQKARFRKKKAAEEKQVGLDRAEETKEKEILTEVERAWRTVSPENRVRMIEQFLLLCLIFARWLLPRAGITRQQLSQLLLVNIGMGADILELFEAFKEPVVRQDFLLTISILSLWQASLLQFCLTKTATKARRMRGGFSQTLRESDSWSKLTGCLFCETELWAISTSVLLQDGPFLVLRVVLIVQYQVASYSNIFFTCKNTLVILLQIFRVGVIIFESRSEDSNLEEELSYMRQNRSVTVLGENTSHDMHKQGSSHSPTVNSIKSAHMICQKKSDSNFFLQIQRCSSQNQMFPVLTKTSSFLI